MTPTEQMEQIVRLEQIFMPYSQQQRCEAYKRQTGSDPKPGAIIRFAHYTSATAALSIINEKRLWMRNTNCMSDYSEVQHGFDMLHEFFLLKNPGWHNLSAALDNCAPGIADEAVNLFNGWFDDIRLNTYLTSVSEHNKTEDSHGRLSMWRAFGGNAARVALVFKIYYFSEAAAPLRVMFSPVSYLPKERVHEELRKIAENISAQLEYLQSIERPALLRMMFQMLVAGVVCAKHEGFHEEQEWRIIYSPNRGKSTLIKSEIKVISGVPQLVHLLPLDISVSSEIADVDFTNAFDRLIIGPSPYPWPMREAFSEALSNAGVTDAKDKVFVSEIPIRP